MEWRKRRCSPPLEGDEDDVAVPNHSAKESFPPSLRRFCRERVRCYLKSIHSKLHYLHNKEEELRGVTGRQHEPYLLLEKTRISWKEKEDGFCLRREAQTLTRSRMKREAWCEGRDIS